MKSKAILIIITMVLIFVFTAGSGRLFVTKAEQGPLYQNNIMNVVVISDDGNCSFRTGPGLEFGVIQLIYNGTSLKINGVCQNNSDGLVWGLTNFNGISGWISLRLTRVTGIENASKACYDVTVNAADYIYLREGPGTEFNSLYKPYNGQVLRIDQTVVNSFDGRPWGRTTINGIQGWVSLNWTVRNNSWTYNQAKDIAFTENMYNAVVSVGDDGLQLHKGPGQSYPYYDSVLVRNGASVFVTAVMDNSQDGIVWGQTTYNGNSGWIPMNYTKIITQNHSCYIQYYTTVQNSANIRLRQGPGAEYWPLVNSIPDGTVLLITDTVINSFDGRPWGKTIYNGIEGWVSLNWTWRAPGR